MIEEFHTLKKSENNNKSKRLLKPLKLFLSGAHKKKINLKLNVSSTKN